MKTKDKLVYISFMGDNIPLINMNRNNASISDASREFSTANLANIYPATNLCKQSPYLTSKCNYRW